MQKPVSTKRHRSLSEIYQLLARFRQSGLSQLRFARDEGVCLSTLHRYLKRFADVDPSACSGFAVRPSPVAFLEIEAPHGSDSVQASMPNPQQRSPFRLTLASGSVLEIPAGFCRGEAEFLLALVTNPSSK